MNPPRTPVAAEAPRRTTEPVAFGTAVEALVQRTLHGKLDARARERLRAIGVEVDNVQVAYAYTTWRALLDELVQLIYPGLPRDEAERRLGQDYLRGLEHTIVGKAVYAMMHFAGPRRMLEKMTRNVRTANNFMESRLEPLADGTYRMHYSVVPELAARMRTHPPPSLHYFRGILEGALTAAKVKDIRVELESTSDDGRAAAYRISFTA